MKHSNILSAKCRIPIKRNASLNSDRKDLETAGVSRICMRALHICVRMLDARAESDERKKKKTAVPRSQPPKARFHHFQISFIATEGNLQASDVLQVPGFLSNKDNHYVVRAAVL